jgi:predicted MFS family arabinose efflux permease
MALLYTLRAGYSYAKPYIRKQYGMSNFFISVVDAFQFCGLGIAFLVKYKIFGNVYTVGEFKTNGLLMCIFYLLMPLLPLIQGHIITEFYGVLLVSSFLFGFLQFCFQPTLIQEMKKYYTSEEDEFMLSCWDSGKHLGRVMGFVLMEIEIINFLWSWNASLIVLIGLMMVDIGLIYYYCEVQEHGLSLSLGLDLDLGRGMIRRSSVREMQERVAENTDITMR